MALPITTPFGPSPPLDYEDDIFKSLEPQSVFSKVNMTPMQPQSSLSSPHIGSVATIPLTNVTQPPTPDSSRKRVADEFEEDIAADNEAQDFTLIPSLTRTPSSTQKTLFPTSTHRPTKRQRIVEEPRASKLQRRADKLRAAEKKAARARTFRESKFSINRLDSDDDYRQWENINVFYFAHIFAGMKARKEGLPEPVSARYYDSERDYVKDPLRFPLTGRVTKSKGKTTTTTPSPRVKPIARAPRPTPNLKTVTPKKEKPKAVGKKIERMDWRSLDDVCPPVDNLNGKTWQDISVSPIASKNGPPAPKNYSEDPDYSHLHHLEQVFVSKFHITPDKFLFLKGLIFNHFVRTKTQNPDAPFGRTQAQVVKHLDANKISKIHEFFENAGWYNPKYYPQINWSA